MKLMSSALVSVALSGIFANVAMAEPSCLAPNTPGVSKLEIRVVQLMPEGGQISIITPNNNGKSLKIPDTLCFSKEKLDKLEVFAQTKEPLTVIVKDNNVLDIL